MSKQIDKVNSIKLYKNMPYAVHKYHKSNFKNFRVSMMKLAMWFLILCFLLSKTYGVNKVYAIWFFFITLDIIIVIHVGKLWHTCWFLDNIHKECYVICVVHRWWSINLLFGGRGKNAKFKLALKSILNLLRRILH